MFTKKKVSTLNYSQKTQLKKPTLHLKYLNIIENNQTIKSIQDKLSK